MNREAPWSTCQDSFSRWLTDGWTGVEENVRLKGKKAEMVEETQAGNIFDAEDALLGGRQTFDARVYNVTTTVNQFIAVVSRTLHSSTNPRPARMIVVKHWHSHTENALSVKSSSTNRWKFRLLEAHWDPPYGNYNIKFYPKFVSSQPRAASPKPASTAQANSNQSSSSQRPPTNSSKPQHAANQPSTEPARIVHQQSASSQPSTPRRTTRKRSHPKSKPPLSQRSTAHIPRAQQTHTASSQPAVTSNQSSKQRAPKQPATSSKQPTEQTPETSPSQRQQPVRSRNARQPSVTRQPPHQPQSLTVIAIDWTSQPLFLQAGADCA
ncbi:hypothetical protein C0Q70_02265 [Pomacea canaliculata]|uniref:Uncharacterized protein n=1 Tax=Pomacea canaliculata TaxID=400727 RepID=A0A2T7PPH2_POMCA|nr:hypothetical protein C0Q70_02265 [Pomacea canaliculata]